MHQPSDSNPKEVPVSPVAPQAGRLGESLDLRLESALYLAVLALAAFVRLYRLGLAPLSSDEAAQALAAWRGAVPPPGASPVLYTINSILFALLGTGDGLARLGAAMFGVALVGVPFFLRHRLGRIGALGAALVLALSPTAIVASRTLSGEIVVALAGLGLLAAGDHYLQTHSRRWMVALAALVALGLTSGSGIYSLAIVFAGGLGLWRLAGERTSMSLDWKHVAILVVTGVVGLSTALVWRPAGLSAVGGLLSAWLQGFQLNAGDTYWYLPFQLLIFYELLALLAGLAGLIAASLRNDLFGVFLGYWAVIATFVIALRQGRTPQDAVQVIVPLACLAGYAVNRLAGSFHRPRLTSLEIAFVGAALVILAFELLGLADYAINAASVQTVQLAGRTMTIHRAAVQEILASTLLGIAILLLIGLKGYEIALRGSALAALIMLALGSWSVGWGAAQLHPGDPRELLAGPRPTSLSMRLLVATLENVSEQQTGQPHTLPLSVVTQSSVVDDVLKWTLRNFTNAQFVSTLNPLSAPYTVVAPLGTTPALASSYSGQDFAMITTWTWGGRAGAESLRWMLYRWSPDAPLVEETLVVWVRQALAAQQTAP